jgi:hypothetical protein
MARSADARGIERSAGDRDFRRRGVGGNCPSSLFDRDTSRPCGVSGLPVSEREDALHPNVLYALSVIGRGPQKTGELPDDAVSATVVPRDHRRERHSVTLLSPRESWPRRCDDDVRPTGWPARPRRRSDRGRRLGLSRSSRSTPTPKTPVRRARGVHLIEAPPWPFFRWPLRTPSRRPELIQATTFRDRSQLRDTLSHPKTRTPLSRNRRGRPRRSVSHGSFDS